MNTGQTILTIGAMTILGYTIMTTNRSTLTHGVILQQTEIGIYMNSLAVSLIEEATGKAFDENTIDSSALTTSHLTPRPLLGRDGSGPDTEVYPHFDDFDDYHNFVKIDTIPGVDVLTTRAQVYYVTATNPDVVSTNRTYHKRMDVSVVGTATNDTLRMSYIYSYWFFR